jgi:hypothetical protein
MEPQGCVQVRPIASSFESGARMDGDSALKHTAHYSLGVRVKINQTVLPPKVLARMPTSQILRVLPTS